MPGREQTNLSHPSRRSFVLGSSLATLLAAGCARPMLLDAKPPRSARAQRLLAAIDDIWIGKPDRFFALMDRDFTAGAGVAATPLAFVQSYATFASAVSELNVAINEVRETGDQVVIDQRLSGVHSGWLGGSAPDGEPLDLLLRQVFVFSGDLVVSVHSSITPQGILPDPVLSRPANARRKVPVARLAQFPPGSFPEGLVVDEAGNAFVSMLFSNEIWKIEPTGKTEIWKKLPFKAGAPPVAEGLFCLARSDNGELLASVAGSPPIAGVWSVPREKPGAMRVGQLPLSAAPNGIAMLDQNRALVADSFGGVLHVVDLQTGQTSVWFGDPILKGRPFAAAFPGANGVQRSADEIIVTISDTGLIIAITITPQGNAGSMRVLANDLAADDFSIGSGGELYLTTHPFNSVVCLHPHGHQEYLAGIDEGVIGPTACAWRAGDTRHEKLYVVTDGGLYKPVPGRPIEPELVVLSLA